MATTYHTNLVNVVTQYLRRLNVKATDLGIREKLEQNSYFPSLFSVKNTMDRLRIMNEAFSIEPADLGRIEAPFMAYLASQKTGKDFVLVTAITPEQVFYISEGKRETSISREQFVKNWERIVLVAEPGSESGEHDYKANLQKEKKNRVKRYAMASGSLLLLFLVVTSFFLTSTAGSISLMVFMLATKITGCALTILLVAYDIDQKNSFVKQLCSVGKQINCNAILNGKSSGIAGLKWSEAGFFYFAATLLFLLYPSLPIVTKMTWLSFMAASVSPYILFSLYYQYRVAKQWCTLCLAVQAILFSELIWAISNFINYGAALNVTPVLLIGGTVCIGLPVIAWYALNPLIRAARETKIFSAAYRRLLYDPEQFSRLLLQQPKASDGWKDIGLTVGNPNAKTSIVKVCNPYCGPCAKAHPELEKIIENNDDVNLKIVFTAANSDTDAAAKPVRHLLAIAEKGNTNLTKEALDNWYNAPVKDYNAFAAKYPMNGELARQGTKLERMSEWCRSSGIIATPTIFINGWKLPESYNINELKNIL